jgi:hypothetical protein
MRAVINNKVYDTGTARPLGANKGGDTTESLYRKRTGEFFIHSVCKASAESKAGRRNDEAIVPCDFEAARKWAKSSLSKPLYERLFSGRAGDKSVLLGARVKEKTVAKLERLQSETGRSIGELVDDAVSQYGQA